MQLKSNSEDSLISFKIDNTIIYLSVFKQNPQMKKLIICIAFLLVAMQFTNAQTSKNITTINQVWLTYNNQVKFNNKWELVTDFNLRSKEKFVHDLSISIVRFGITYYLSPETKLTTGYAWANYFPGDNHKNISQTEHRPWQQIQWETKHGKNKLIQWIRLEERFKHKILNDHTLGEGYNFNYRLRLHLRYELPINKKIIVPGSLALIISDEVNVNFGKEIINNYFDQNRFFTGFKYQTGVHTSLQFGYLNIFQQLSAGNQYKNVNALRASFYQNIDLSHHFN